jgi:biopolymer transport protein ExbD
MKFKQYFIIIVFVALTIFMSVYSFLGNREKLIVPKKSNAQMSQSNEGEESYFKMVNYFILNEGKPFLKLEASELVLSNQNKRVLSFNPNGIIYRRNKLQKN